MLLPEEMAVHNLYFLMNTCSRLDYNFDGEELPLNCLAKASYFDVWIDDQFGSAGLPAQEDFRLQVQSLRNPRPKSLPVSFSIQSYDSEDYLIDESVDSDSFTIEMTSIGKIEDISIGMDSPMNGAYTTYNFVIRPNTPFFSMDFFDIDFPSEVTLPSTATFDCEGESNKIITIICLRRATGVRVQFTRVTTINPGSPFYFKIHNVRNPPSTRETSSFAHFLLRDRTSLQVADYEKEVTV